MNVAIIPACMSAMPAFFKTSKATGSFFFTSIRSRLAKDSQSRVALPLKDGNALLSHRTKKSKEEIKHLEPIPLPPRIYRNSYVELEEVPNAGISADKNRTRDHRMDAYLSTSNSFGNEDHDV